MRLKVVAAIGPVALISAHAAVVRPWSRRWGATDDEVRRAMPGDGVVLNAGYVATRAVTIKAPPEQVWPWLVQIGSGRAGWYSYDRVDNAGRPSARRILAEPEAGSQVYSPSGQEAATSVHLTVVP